MTVGATAGLARERSERVQRIAAHLREPLHRNGYALVASTFSTSVLGLLYWAIAAHSYNADRVGLNASLVSTMMFLTNLASLNFTDVLNRFVPVAGGRTRRLVDVSYLIAVALGGVAAIVFVLGRNVWTPRLQPVLHGFGLGVLFVVTVMFWTIFVLQDAVLVGLRRATYVFAENTVFGIVKIVLLLAFAAALPTTGIFLSWSIPVIAVVFVISGLLFRQFLPQHMRDHSGVVETVDRRAVTPFLGADYVASVAGTTATSLMPLIVLASSGAADSGYVFITWTIAYTLYLVSRNIGMSLTTEGATDPANLASYTRSALAASARIVVPLALLIAAGAPLYLHVFTPAMAKHASGLMSLFALSAIPAIVPTTVIAVARVQRRLGRLIAVSVGSTLPTLPLIPVFTHFFGIAGAGLAWLLVQTVAAVVLLASALRHARSSTASDGTAAPTDTWLHSEASWVHSTEPTPVVETAPRGTPRPARAPAPYRWWWAAVTIGVGALAWIISLARLDTRTLGSFGLVSNLPFEYFVGIAIVAIGFVVALARGARPWVLAAHGAVVLLMLHATPAIGYAELRYAWAWKHVGVVDMLQHHHAITGGTAVLDIYRHWPGFFSAATALVDATGIPSALSFASWGPPFFALLDAALLAIALRTLTDDRRRIALAVWLFMIANWVGQDYFAPQAFGFALYLALIAIVLHTYQRPGARTDRFRSRATAPPHAEITVAPGVAAQRRGIAVVLLVLMVAMTTSHPLTPIVACISLGALLACRVLDRRWPFVAMLGITVGWLVTGAGTYTLQNLKSILNQVGRLGSNVDSNLASFGNLSPAQHTVANMGRMVVAVIAVLAIAGLVRRLRHGYFDRASIALCIAPALLLAAGAYGGEAIFRAYLFALPFAAFLAAGLFFPSVDVRPSWRSTVAIGTVTCVVLTGYLFAYYGKEAWSDFTPGEVRAAEAVFDSAPPHSLLIDGTLEYPTQFRNVDHFTYVTIGTEPPGSVKQVLADPVGVLSSWMADRRFAQGYLLLTRSQIAEVDATGQLPKGSLERIERLMLASPKIKVLYHDRDALLVTVDRSTTGGAR